MGRLGGRELSYASDVDLVFVHDGDGDRVEAERIGHRLVRTLHGATPATRILAIDADLRPEGKQGPMARSLDSYTAYLDRWAEVWERQALLRSRPMAGDAGVVGGSCTWSVTRRGIVHRRRTIVREIRRMKARVEAERIPRGIEPWRHVKLGPGGLADIEWTVQLLQWTQGVRDRNTASALDRLARPRRGRRHPTPLASTTRTAGRDSVRNRAWLVRRRWRRAARIGRALLGARPTRWARVDRPRRAAPADHASSPVSGRAALLRHGLSDERVPCKDASMAQEPRGTQTGARAAS